MTNGERKVMEIQVIKETARKAFDEAMKTAAGSREREAAIIHWQRLRRLYRELTRKAV